jgi:polyhydroxybutyrate depolymerase
MKMWLLFLGLFAVVLTGSAAVPPGRLSPGEYRREVQVHNLTRSYWLHVPKSYDERKPMPVVIAFHGALMNGRMMEGFCGLSAKADAAGFIVAYPNGTGWNEQALTFNASLSPEGGAAPDDVAFTGKILDDLEAVLNVDQRRIYATGMSNGGMMCHRVGAELSERIAAIAPVAGTLALHELKPRRAVPVIHFHGTQDTLVPVGGPLGWTPRTMAFHSVADTIKQWVKADGCEPAPSVTQYPHKAKDSMSVSRTTYRGGRGGAEVVLVMVDGGGHTWPGQQNHVQWLGQATMDISANDLMWEFFKAHPLPEKKGTK